MKNNKSKKQHEQYKISGLEPEIIDKKSNNFRIRFDFHKLNNVKKDAVKK